MKQQTYKLIDKCIKDKHGHIVIFQSPNLSLISYFVFSILDLIFRSGAITYFFKALSFGSLFTWSWLEIFYGVNYFRRILGLVIMIGNVMFFVDYIKLTIPSFT